MKLTRIIPVAVAAAAMAVPAAAAAQDAASGAPGCEPTSLNRPVCPRHAPLDAATFLDPTAHVHSPHHIRLGSRIYVAPFASLDAREAPIRIGAESNVQDSVRILAAKDDGDDLTRHDDEDEGVVIGERVILAHGATVKGPARIGVDSSEADAAPETFIFFGAEVDGAIIEKGAQVGPLARVGPGIRLKSGKVVLPGKNVATQADLDDPEKVRDILGTEEVLAEAVIHVNTTLAREYTRMYSEEHASVRGINLDPGNPDKTEFNPERNLPETGATGPAVPHAAADAEDGQRYCNGTPTRDPDFRNRIIGAVCLEDSRQQLGHKLGHEVSLRADEGEAFSVGHIHSLGSHTTFHALEEADLEVGDGVTYGPGALVHGGNRELDGGGVGPTVVEDHVKLRGLSVVFRSHIGEGATVGYKSAVIASEIPAGEHVDDRTIVVNGQSSKVEW
jgi:carbonic anhydrase/acetyltransferase-like protein (isoleucine patch superfamily)